MRDVGFIVRVEIRSDESMLDTPDAIHLALD
jgi:hypothetical protein